MKTYSDSTLKGMKKDDLIAIIRCLEHNISVEEERNQNQFDLLMQEDLRKAKYRWHDLRKDLNDFPEFNGNEVEVMFLTEHGFYNIGYYGENGHYRDKYFRDSRDAYEGYDIHCVVAWKYPDQFKEE